MNKAFVREPDDTGQRYCPKCGSLGSAVPPQTIAAQVVDGVQGTLSETAFFCSFANCPVVYFDDFERIITTEALQRPIYPKDPDAPICGCFGLGREDVEQDIREGGVKRVRALLEKSKSPAAECVTKSANGHCCMTEVQRYYMRLKSQQS